MSIEEVFQKMQELVAEQFAKEPEDVTMDTSFEEDLGADSVDLWRKPYSMKDEKGKITASGFTYSVVSLDEDETVYMAQVKPSRKSDKALLEKIIELSMRSIAREEE